jgi:selenocysteine lyase/cysteine desulfurase
VSTPLPRNEFAVTRRYVYLNHAAAGVLPARTVGEIERFVRAHNEHGVLGTFPYDLKMPEYRETIGRFVGGSGTAIATIPNTSAGAATIAQGIDWKTADEVLLCDDEFPANVVPWLALERRGVDVRLLRSEEGRLTPERLRRELSPRTRLVTASWVSYADGYRRDLGGLATAAHDAGALFCVDAIQGLGVFTLDAPSLGIDALYSGAGKWMMGLHGGAFLYLSDELNERLEVAMPGWRSMRDMWDFHNYSQPLTPDAYRFEGGTPNLLGALSMACAIELFEQAGRSDIERHVLALTDRLHAGLADLGAEFSSERGDGCSSGIVTFSMPGCDSIELGTALEREEIVTTYRTSGIRVSPHGYNTSEEIDTVLSAIARIARKNVSV